MKKFHKILSLLLAFVCVMGTVSGLFTLTTAAADVVDASKINYKQYYAVAFNSPEEKLGIMTPYIETGAYRLYVNDYTGEIALLQKSTGEIMFSNPYDLSASVGANSVKTQLLSQIIVQYTDASSTSATAKYMYSFEEATLRDQVLVKNIKNGVRVEYVLGEESTRKLVPRMISVQHFESMIYNLVNEGLGTSPQGRLDAKKFYNYYDKKSLAEATTQAEKATLTKTYEILRKDPTFEFYVFMPDASETEINWAESMIKTYCPNYTFEQMERDHEECLYKEEEMESPVFKMALEYKLDENGLSVTLPANGLRYNSSKYTLEQISVLPFMGAGNSANDGYLFYPDGSGALFDFDTPDTKTTTTIRGQVYGKDFAYHDIVSGKYQQNVSCAVFGLVEEQEYYTYSFDQTIYTQDDIKTVSYEDYTVSRSVKTLDEIMAEIEDPTNFITLTSDIKTNAYKTGFLAIIEEGESLASVEVYRPGNQNNYNCVRAYFNPRPKDTYELSDSVSVTENSSWTVISDRKYTGNFTIRYMMLSDPTLAANAGLSSYYEPSYIGMANAYRDYLIENNVLSKLTADAVDAEHIPLYIESFGTIEAVEQFLSIPVTVHKALTTFENVAQMYRDLSEEGITNINFRLTGFANGGLYSTVPAKLKWESAVGGKKGFEELVDYSKEVAEAGGTLGIYPDFDFAYINKNTITDSTSLKKHAVRTIDNRYSSKRYYSATKQKYISYFQYALSPAYYSHFYKKLIDNYENYDIKTLSVSTLGSALNSDFDSSEPYNREDSKVYTAEAFHYLSTEKNYTVMTDVGNSYVWKYADHLLNVSLDSSRYIKASASVPFVGIVLHGYIQFAGSAMNMEGDMEYAMLKAIENGAAPYFTLSYQNTDLLKEDELYSQYYSIRYDIWKKDLVSTYNELNAALADVQLKTIVNHEILTGIRVLDVDEIRAQIEAELEAAEQAEINAERDELLSSIHTVGESMEYIRSSVSEVSSLYTTVSAIMKLIDDSYKTLQKDVERTQLAPNDANRLTMRKDAAKVISAYYRLLSTCEQMEAYLEADEKLLDASIATGAVLPDVENEMKAYIGEVKAYLDRVAVADGYVGEVFTGAGFKEKAKSAYDLTVEAVAAYFTEEEIRAYATIPAEKDPDADQPGQEIEDTVNKALISDNGNIVAVTYGDRNGNEVTAYKIFILNYNNYTVKVVYNGITYSIPSEEYVVITVD